MKNELKLCPFCGNEAKITRAELRDDIERITITCCGCGVQLDWTQEFAINNITYELGKPRRAIRFLLNESAIEVWNRRIENDTV